MAGFYITDTRDMDWEHVNWDNLKRYKYRSMSSDGSPLAQEEFDRKRDAGEPAALWAFYTNDTPPVLLEHCNLAPSAPED